MILILAWACAITCGLISAYERIHELEAQNAELLAALRSAVDMLQECMRSADNDTSDTIDAVLIESQTAIAKVQS